VNPSYNIIFKQRLLRSLGLRMDFGEAFRQTTPLGFMNTETLYDRIKMKKSQKALNLKIYVIRYAGEERP
jgi:hypothetical protein